MGATAITGDFVLDYLPPKSFLVSLADERHKTPRYPCYHPPNPNHCFRGVYDGFNDLLDMVQQHDGDDNTEVHNRIAVLIESLILKPGVPLKRDDNQRDATPSALLLTASIHRHMLITSRVTIMYILRYCTMTLLTISKAEKMRYDS